MPFVVMRRNISIDGEILDEESTGYEHTFEVDAVHDANRLADVHGGPFVEYRAVEVDE